MAAKLKKRALAEYQSQCQVEDEQDRSKRLKLSLRHESSGDSESVVTTAAESVLPCLESSSVGAREVMENILGFDVSTVTSENMVSSLKKISESVVREQDSCVKSRLLLVWAEILTRDNSVEDVSSRVEELLSLSSTEIESDKVLSSWMTALKQVVTRHSLVKSLKQKILTISTSVLHSTSHPVVHCKVILN